MRSATRALVALIAGVTAAVCWLVGPAAPDVRAEPPAPVAAAPDVRAEPPAPVAAAPPGAPAPEGGAPGVDLVVPVALLATALAMAGYAFVTRRRRVRTRTTPHGGPAVPREAELDERARRALVAADDALRTSREELAWARAGHGEAAVKSAAEALAYAEDEVAAAFRLRQRLDDGHPEDEAARRAALEEVVARCADAGRRLDEEAPDFDTLRDLEATAPVALAAAEAAHRELVGRLTTAEAALTAMRGRYARSAAEPVAIAPEVARARLDFAAAALSHARAALAAPAPDAPPVRAADGTGAVQRDGTGDRGADGATGPGPAGTDGAPADPATDPGPPGDTADPPADRTAGTGPGSARDPVAGAGGLGAGTPHGAVGRPASPDAGHGTPGDGVAGDGRRAAVYLRAAEGALDQADQLVEAVDRRAVEIAGAAGRLPDALAEAEADLAEARRTLEGAPGGAASAGGLRGRAARLESVAGDVRRAVEAGGYDPVDALRRLEEADAALDEALARDEGTRRSRAFLEQALLAARSAAGAAEVYVTAHRGAVGSVARTRLAQARHHLTEAAAARDPGEALADAQRADALARQAQALAEQDVRLRGTPQESPEGPGGRDGVGGAVLGGILVGGVADGEPGDMPGSGWPGGPARFGGGGTRDRLAGDAPF
ncbi:MULTISPECIES: hypothetical protein [Streptomyces]|uniref:TPM domain-containing protein n=2 Tax=Streptomyces TaxID=1883 RepID=A0A117IX70_9ACTN|nr:MULTISPECIES: hypothetical protein [Streptomyces]KUH40085.1 hypothetical protein ATE80_03370 [Streptomyces kanasensis]UUS32778.1 hypothetical protein NRO40_19470 [Streptomyces changanensis]